MIYALLLLPLVLGLIEIVESEERYPSRTAAFGPEISVDGLEAFMIPIEFLDDSEDTQGCKPVSMASPSAKHFWDLFKEYMPPGMTNRTIPWIALVERGGCGFTEKVRAMQASGASAVIVGDNMPSNSLIKMMATGDPKDILIPSSFVMQWEYKDLKLEAMKRFSALLKTKSLSNKNSTDVKKNLSAKDKKDGVESPKNSETPQRSRYGTLITKEIDKRIPLLKIIMYPDHFIDLPVFDIILIMLVAPILLIFLLYLVYRLRTGEDFEGFLAAGAGLRPGRDLLRDKPATQAMVDTIPKKIFSDTLDTESVEEDLKAPFLRQDTCAICLDLFEDGEELRHLACHHEFHTECIDPWLLTRKRTCPLCKGDACVEGAAALPPSVASPLEAVHIRRQRFIHHDFADDLPMFTSGAVQPDSASGRSSSDFSFRTAQTYSSRLAVPPTPSPQQPSFLTRLWGANQSDIELARTHSPRAHRSTEP